MLNEVYRTCTDYREILRIFQKSSTLADNFLWQAIDDGKNIIKPQHLEIDFVSRGVTVYFDAFKFKINPAIPLYVKLEYRSSVFKVLDFQVRQYSIHFAFPEILKTKELRSSPRHTLDAEKENYINLRPTLTTLSQETVNEIRVRLIDVSRQGVGMIISENNRSFLKNNRFLWIMEMNGERLVEPLLAEVVYMTSEMDGKYKKGKQKELKVGLKLSGEFPLEFFEKLIS